MAYFTVMTGLRGCYMPDNAYTVRVDTRRELKALIESEASHRRGDGTQGLGKAAVATHAAECWSRRNDARWTMDLVLPYGAGKDRSFGIMVSRATRKDWQEYQKQSES